MMYDKMSHDRPGWKTLSGIIVESVLIQILKKFNSPLSCTIVIMYNIFFCNCIFL